MNHEPRLNLGQWKTLRGSSSGPTLRVPARHLVTHGVVVGMTGSGKTGLVTVIAEEALRAEVPTLIIDVKGDLPNLLLSFPSLSAPGLEPWLNGAGERLPPEKLAEIVERMQSELSGSGITEPDLAAYVASSRIRLLTPGSTAGESLHVLSSLERRSPLWDTDRESARDALSAAVSLLLRLLGRDPDPAKSREHILLCVLAERRLAAGENADIGALMEDLLRPPISTVGALPLNSFFKKAERSALAAALNGLIASPTFASWREGASLDVASWFERVEGKTPCVILSVAHLDDEERALVLGLVFEAVLSWVRGLPGSSQLRALVVFDEVYGFLPPHPANPPTKRPIVSLMKQARAFGVGVVLATQNPMDIDYRALSNAGLWCIGRLQTDADRARVVEGLAASMRIEDTKDLAQSISGLGPRSFLVRNAHVPEAGAILLRPRHTISLLRGPLTRLELQQAQKMRSAFSAPSA